MIVVAACGDEERLRRARDALLNAGVPAEAIKTGAAEIRVDVLDEGERQACLEALLAAGIEVSDLPRS